MISTIESLENQHLDFKLGEEQKTVLCSIFNFIIDRNSTHCTLSGFAGSGKTTMMKLIIHYLESINKGYILAAPTHKAKNVLSNFTNRGATTLHQLLTLKANIDILELDMKDLNFISIDSKNDIPYYGVIIVDECSMVNEVLFDFIIEKAESKNAKVLFIGDKCQLAPVNENKLSKVFDLEPVYNLTKVYRQKGDNKILDLLYELRSTYKFKFDEINSPHGSLIKYKNWKTFLKDNINEFKEMVKTKNTSHVKLIAYTNKRVEAFNHIIRKLIWDNNVDEYVVGDILTGYDNSSTLSDGPKLINSSDYVITHAQQVTKYIKHIKVIGWELTLLWVDENIILNVFVLSKSNDISIFTDLADLIETTRLKAIQTKFKKASVDHWKEYYSINEQFITPIDLVYDGRVIRRKSIDYGYCITTHKSQSATYNSILVDMDNLLLCSNKLELRQLQYVALSRTSKDIKMLTIQ